MNHSFATKPDQLRANPKWRPKAGSFANSAIAHLPRFYTKTIGLLAGIHINNLPGPRKLAPKHCNH